MPHKWHEHHSSSYLTGKHYVSELATGPYCFCVPWRTSHPRIKSHMWFGELTLHEDLIVFEKLFCQEKNGEEDYLQMWSGHTDDVSGVTLELMAGFVHSFTPSSSESWGLQQWEQTEKEDSLISIWNSGRHRSAELKCLLQQSKVELRVGRKERRN